VAVLVKESDKDRENAVYVNSFFPQKLAAYCRNKKTKIVHLSSGGVFSGRDNDAYYEKSLLSPSTFYGATKAAGEIINNKDLTVRTDFWGPDINENGGGLFHWLMLQDGTIKGYDDIYFNGISSLEFCNFLDRLFNNDNLSGIVHLGAKKEISKGSFLRLINDVFKLDLEIERSINMKSSVILKNTFSIDYPEKTYEEMCEDLKLFILNTKALFNRYFKKKTGGKV
jgi:dTDP-4-dehydrorhamnose reductase